MKPTEQEILLAAKKLGAAKGTVKNYVRKFGGKVDMNQLSIAIWGEPYKERPKDTAERCPRCHWPKCNCAEGCRNKDNIVWESK